MNRAAVWLPLVFGTFGSGCAEAPVGQAPVVRDSAGVRVVENPQQTWAATGTWRIGEAPQVDLGGAIADSTAQFCRVAGAVRLSDGRIVVANAGTGELRFFDGEGRFLASAGRAGNGPGEFQRIAWLARYRGDSLVVFDRRSVRLSVFDAHGRYARSVAPRDASGRTVTGAVGAFADGSFLVVFESLDGDLPAGVFRPSWHAFLADPEGTVGAPVGVYAGAESYMHAFAAGGGMDAPRAFGLTTEIAVAGTRFYAVPTESFEIGEHDGAGALRSIVRRGHTPVPVTAEDGAVVTERELYRARNVPELQSQLREFLGAMPMPQQFPAIGAVRVDDGGNLWVQEYLLPRELRRRSTIFDPDGVVLAMLESPEGFEPLHIGEDFVLGRWTDEDGEEHVRQYALVKG